MKSLKITKLLNLLTTGAVVGGTAAGGVLIATRVNNNNVLTDDTRFDISSLNNSILSRPFSGTPRAESLISSLVEQFPSLESENQLVITNINQAAQTFTLSAVSNSTYYIDNKSATIRWNVPAQDNDFTQITGSTFGIDLLIWEDMASDRNTFLNSMKDKFPALDVNQLYIDTATIDNVNRSATVRVVTDSALYDTTKTATVIAGFTQAVDLSFNNSTLTQTVLTATPTIKYKGAILSNTAPGLVWTCSTTASPVAFNATNGTLTLTSGTDFAGGMYTITATYTISGNIFTARQQVYVQEYMSASGSITGIHGYFKTIQYANVTRIGKSVTLLFLCNAMNGAINAGSSLWTIPSAFLPSSTYCVSLLGTYNNGANFISASLYSGTTTLAIGIPSGAYNVYLTGSWLTA